MRCSIGLGVQSKAMNVLNGFFDVMRGHTMTKILLPPLNVDPSKHGRRMNKREYSEIFIFELLC